MPTPIPTLENEKALLIQGYRIIAGVDEAGRGSIFGPVCVGMVILPLDDFEKLTKELSQVRDSKKLYRPKVYRLADKVKEIATAWSVGQGMAKEVDEFGIVGAIRLAVERALAGVQEKLESKVEYLLTDSTLPTPRGFPEDRKMSMVGGDMYCLSIACAAILAKENHDEIVRKLAENYPSAYQLENNVGYGTLAHLRAIQRLGPTPHHRHSFKPVSQSTATKR